MNDKKFVGRDKEIEEFKEFLLGERPNWGGRGKGAPLLFVVGDRGIGKGSLLQAMAQQAEEQEHYVIAQPVDENLPFDKQIYSLIAMAKRGKPFKWKGIDFIKVALTVLDIAEPRVRKLVDLGREILKDHEKYNYNENYLAQMLHSALSKLDGKMGGARRIIILLYPKTKSPARLIPLLEYMSMAKVLPKVRFVIAQTPKDTLIEAARKGQPRKLQEICAKQMKLGKMEPEDSREFIRVYDTECKLNEVMREVFLERYGGWPELMELALQELPEKGEITEEDIRSLPSDINGIWDERYQEVYGAESERFLHTVCLLPHPYEKERVRDFARLRDDELLSVWKDGNPVWQLLDKREDYDDIYTGERWKKCPDPKHATAKEYVLEYLKDFEGTYRDRLIDIVSHYKDRIWTHFEDKDVDRDALANLLSYMIVGGLWDGVEELLTNIGYLTRKLKPEEQYNFQNDFISLLNNENITYDRLVNILEGVFNTVCEQLETERQKADWLDTFAYWINEFGVKDDRERSLALKDVAGKFDRACGVVSKELAETYLKEGKNGLALRFAELWTWVYERAGEYDECADACRHAEKMCLQEGMEDAYQYLGRAEFIRLRAHALTTLSRTAADGSKKTEDERKAHEAYEELNKVFPAERGESQWPTIQEWKELEELLGKNTDEVLTPPYQARSDKSRAFKAKVVSNLADCISAMHIIRFFEEHNGLVEWIHHNKFEPEQFAPEDTLFTVLVGGPKSPGISKVAYEFYKTDKDDFLQMYSGLSFRAYRLETLKGKTQCYMLGGISKVNTLMAAYEFTEDSKVREIIKKGQPLK